MLTLFLAEDDPLMSRMYERAFKAAGFDLKMTFDGEEAINSLKTIKPEPTIAVLDIMMPKLSGFDVLRFMKATENLKSVPVVLLTNLAGEADAQKGLELGAVAYLVKSKYTPKEIVDKIKEIAAGYSRKEDIPEVKTVVKDTKIHKN
jgi:DNA-binding response OmpR family regulator